MTDGPIAPHGGRLTNLLVDPDRGRKLREEARDLPGWRLSPRQICDLELLLNGGFSPLAGYHTRREYDRVCREMRLADGTLWPIPVTLDLPDDSVRKLAPGGRLALRDSVFNLLAVLHVEDIWRPDRKQEARSVLGTEAASHPAVASLRRRHPNYVGGGLEGVSLPVHHDFPDLRRTPAQVRGDFDTRGWRRVAAFQTRNPIHRAHHEMMRRTIHDLDLDLLIHPVVGPTLPGDIDPYTRVRCYRAILGRCPAERVQLALLPLAMRFAGPREALWHAIIRKNYGCTHFIVGRYHAGVGEDAARQGPYAALELLKAHESELGIQPVPFRTMVYVEKDGSYRDESDLGPGVEPSPLSGTDLRERLETGREIPEWFTFPEVLDELRRAYPPRWRRGFTVFFTGLPGAGKSTLAGALRERLRERTGRPITLLDGDVIRSRLSPDLGFSPDDRRLNVERVAYVAGEVTRHGGIAICALIAPRGEHRTTVREIVRAQGGFVLVHVATPRAVCESRDPKGLYALARAGKISDFTGVSAPYEEPTDAELVLDTTEVDPEAATRRIIRYLERENYLEALSEP